MIVFIPLCCFAQKEGKLKFGTYGSYKGMVANNKPMGEGVLTYKWKESTFAVKMIDKISGKFSGNIVDDAIISFAARKCFYMGNLKYEIQGRDKLVITMLNGVLDLKGKKYNIKNGVYLSNGEKSTCEFGENNIMQIGALYKDDYLDIGGIITASLPVKLEIPISLNISISVDRYDGCQLTNIKEISGNPTLSIKDEKYNLDLNENLKYEDAGINLELSGQLRRNNDSYSYISTSSKVKREYKDGTYIEAYYDRSCSSYVGNIIYSNGDIYNGSFLIEYKDLLDQNYKTGVIHNINGILRKANGDEIGFGKLKKKEPSPEDIKAEEEIKLMLAKCDSLWYMKTKKCNKDIVKRYLVGKKYAYYKDSSIAGIPIKRKTIVSFIDEDSVSVRVEPILTSETHLPENYMQLHMFLGYSEKFGEDQKFDGEYTLVNGHLILRMDYRYCLKKIVSENMWLKPHQVIDMDLKDCSENRIKEYIVSKDFKSLIPYIPEGYSNQIYRVEK